MVGSWRRPSGDDAPRPGLLFMSGYTDDAVFRHGVRHEVAFLQEPYGNESLLRRVRAVLDDARSAASSAAG